MPLYVRTLLLTGPLAETEAATEGHRRHLDGLRADGRLKVEASFRRDEGFLEIFEAKDLLEAGEIARTSPLVEQGLGAWILRELQDLRVG